MPDIQINQIKKCYDQFKKLGLVVKKNEPLNLHTTIHTGGPATLIVFTPSSYSLQVVLKYLIKFNLPYLLLGNGSNVVISDDGFEGIVIINTAGNWQILNEEVLGCPEQLIPGRLQNSDAVTADKSTVDNGQNIIIRVDSGLKLNSLTNALYKEDIYGLQWFAGIPATVGGAIYMNIHGGHKYFSSLIHSARLSDGTSEKTVDNKYFEFDYDWSILHKTGEIILHADLCLKKGPKKTAQDTGKLWAKSKSNQPQNSAGCIFKNLTSDEQERLDLPSPSIGYLIEHVLKLKGIHIGGACISDKHAAFIENTGNASSSDVLSLIELVREKAKKDLNLDLELEVELINQF